MATDGGLGVAVINALAEAGVLLALVTIGLTVLAKRFEKRMDQDDARRLERYKTDLGLDSEVRRIVATRKVDLLCQLVELAADMEGHQFARGASKDGRNRAVAAFVDYLHHLGNSAHLLSAPTFEALSDYATRVRDVAENWGEEPRMHELTPLNDELMTIVRRELGTDGGTP